MGATGQGALIGLSKMITARAEREKARQFQMEDEQRQNQSKMIDAAIASGNLNQDQINQALEQKKKLYPKEVHPLIDKMGEVLGHVFNIKKNSPQAMSEQPPIAGVPSSTGQVTTSGSVTPSSNGTPASPAAPVAANNAPATPNSVPSSMASILATANPNPVTKARTAAQASLAGDEVIQGDRNTRAQKLIQDMKASGVWTPQAETAIQMEAQGFTVPASMMKTSAGKAPKVTFNQSTGTVESITDPSTNESYYSKDDIPTERADLAQSWASAEKRGKEVQDQIIDRENRNFDHRMAVERQTFQDALAAHDYKKAKDAVDKSKDILSDATDRRNTMDENLKDMVAGDSAGKPNQQAMLSLVANHLGMTAGAQKGARITQAVWNEAMNSTPWLLGKLGRLFRPSENGDMELTAPLGGVSITQDQAKQMVALAHQKTAQLRDRVQRTENDYADDLAVRKNAVPLKMKGATKKAAGKIVVTPEDMANAH
jgi:hypothetical protein